MINKKLLEFFKDKEVIIITLKPNYRGKIVKITDGLIVIKSERHTSYINQENIIALEDYNNEIYKEKTT